MKFQLFHIRLKMMYICYELSYYMWQDSVSSTVLIISLAHILYMVCPGYVQHCLWLLWPVCRNNLTTNWLWQEKQMLNFIKKPSHKPSDFIFSSDLLMNNKNCNFTIWKPGWPSQETVVNTWQWTQTVTAFLCNFKNTFSPPKGHKWI